MKKPRFRLIYLLTILSIFPFGISIIILIKNGLDNIIAMYWFIVGIAFLFLPYISELKFKDIEIKIKDAVASNMEDITKKLDEIAPRRFANLIYLITKDKKIALIKRPEYNNILVPPGKRLGYHEQPHDAIYSVLKDYLGLKNVHLHFWPKFSRKNFRDKSGAGKVVTVPVPYQVQQEIRTHEKGIPEHYDFVYVCTIDEAVDIDGELNPDWYSFSELKEMEQKSRFGITFPDVLPTLESIILELEKENYFLNK